ncbi:TPA: single-stranded DNA-binding protein [Haemophilus influenzae]|uniref:single-stranded DNA-binding protein n=1 Tax=Haemophilus influenzae TaxID=727 RepID=UPI000CFEC150|nr:single-stranded DNA-binding protein [Haemophilus influenzae]PRI47046.1 Single-stranded DNA-binding protein [Haemophilus influenzae]PRI85213.1 Single-stranded DNA-binding protein [Haemophilus influenzae]PRI86199.1 Single-stranded DNA-binding protein [Haemophilus influenzae]PRJ82244.1 Single-stranded DNA-binding protein [Haemophilus influenzae]PRM42884.1 Single-stranded DNA-binding protein [Haemophilus influenzae]
MARNTNTVILVGHLGSDPEIRQFPNGGQIATFNLAIGDDYRDKQGNTVKRTHWIPIVVHGNSADVARQYLQKGSKICVTGKLVQESWQDQNGNNRTALKVATQSFEMLDSKASSETQQPTKDKEKPDPLSAAAEQDGFDDDIPF